MIARIVRRLRDDRKGATAVEYGLIVALIVLGMIASFTQVAKITVGMWNNVNAKVSAASEGQ